MSDDVKHFYEFGEFRLDAENPSLWRGGKLVPIFPKALDILVLLVRGRGEIITREELLETVWRDTFVEESNITYTVSQLRKALGGNGNGNYIQTVPKRGYRFVAEVRTVADNGSVMSPTATLPAAIEPEKAPVRWHFISIMLVGLLLAASFTLWLGFGDPLSRVPATHRNIRAIAILPLEQLPGSERDDALSLALTDSLIARLGSLNRFAVRPLSAVRNYEGSGQDRIKFGEMLKVDAVLEGTLQRSEDRLRVNMRLVDVRDGTELWQDSFDASETDFFGLQDAVAIKVSQSLLSELLETDRLLLAKRHTDNPDAFQAYIRGRAIFDKKNPGNAEKAIDEYQKAVALDPTFALAYAGLADALSRQARNLPRERAGEGILKAKAAANKALALDPELAEAYASLGLINRFHEWDWAGAEKNLKRAVELNPNYAYAHLWYAHLLAMVGRTDEALVAATRAIEIDPLTPDVQAGRLAVLEVRGEYAEAAALAREFADFDKQRPLARRGLATFLYHLGDYASVIEICEEDLPKNAGQKYIWLSLAAAAYRQTGQTAKHDEKLKRLETMSETDTQALYSLAENYAELGRIDEAIAALEKCFETREERMAWIKTEPRFARLRSDPRFQEILRKMNLAA